MSGFKHTKGPWEVYKSIHTDFPNHGIDNRDGNFSIIVCGECSEGIQGKSADEMNANATLIAAAPEMLDALIAEYTVLKNIYTAKSMLCGNDVKKVLDAVISVKKHAIECATGMTIDDAIKAYEEDNK